MKKLLVFNATGQIVAKHNFWEDDWMVSDNWKLESGQVAIIVDQNQIEIKPDGTVIQPNGNGFKFVDPNTLIPAETPSEVPAT